LGYISLEYEEDIFTSQYYYEKVINNENLYKNLSIILPIFSFIFNQMKLTEKEFYKLKKDEKLHKIKKNKIDLNNTFPTNDFFSIDYFYDDNEENDEKTNSLEIFDNDDLDISNNIRYGNPSRSNNNNYKEKLESQVSFQYQINYLGDNSVNKSFFTKNTYVPITNIPLYLNDTEFFNRVGENTRKQNDNINHNINRMKETIVFNYDNLDNNNNKITFDYN
jgi:hypothetical protein